ncbi:hypothetical protein D1007_27362 [Hordeum vulgare]|nr:hypothetical protein D1007_27362 [Hordeum vulgare]
MESGPGARDRGRKQGGKHLGLTGIAEASKACSGTAWRGRTTAAINGDPRKKTTAIWRCRARGFFSFGRDDKLDEAERTTCSERLEEARDDGELELELAPMAAERERGVGGRVRRGRGWERVREAYPSMPVWRGGSTQARRCVASSEEAAATSWCRLSRGRRQQGDGLGPGERQVSVFSFLSFLFSVLFFLTFVSFHFLALN